MDEERLIELNINLMRAAITAFTDCLPQEWGGTNSSMPYWKGGGPSILVETSSPAEGKQVVSLIDNLKLAGVVVHMDQRSEGDMCSGRYVLSLSFSG